MFFQPYVQTYIKESINAQLALCEGNPTVTGGFPSQRASNAENISISWRHHDVWSIPGIISGAVTAGVVGYRIPAFDITGDTVLAATKISQAGMVSNIRWSSDNYRLEYCFI